MVTTTRKGVRGAPACDWDTPDNPTFHQWTTVNVAEVIPGVVLPLNASWWQATEKPEMRHFVAAFGASDLVPVYDEPYPNFIGFFSGRAALNMGFVMALLSTYQLEAGSAAAEMFFNADESGGYSVPSAADPERAARNRTRTFRMWGQLPKAVAADRAKAERLERHIASLPLADLPVKRLWVELERMGAKCSTIASNHLLASYAGGEYSSLLGQLLQASVPDAPEDAVVRLTSALEVESTEASVALWQLSRWVRGHPRLAHRIAEATADDLKALIARPPDGVWAEFAVRFGSLLEAHGFHGRNEISLSVPDWSEDPTFLLNSLRVMTGAGEDKDPAALHQAAAASRRSLEEQYRRGLSPGRRRVYDRLLERAQTFVRMRETTKTTLIRSIRPGRKLLVEIGRNLAVQGVIERPEDLYYLLFREVRLGLERGFNPVEVRRLVDRRRQVHAELQHYRLPDNFTGVPTPIPLDVPAAEVPAQKVLQGLGVSGGVATGRARVITDLEQADRVPFAAGDVLVAPLTDAPWTPLFLTAAAVVVETGGLLSHAATVAREFGIPAVAMVSDATRIIRDGQMVTVDGDGGCVSLLEG